VPVKAKRDEQSIAICLDSENGRDRSRRGWGQSVVGIWSTNG